eukprot:TRINITY_DN3107_c0_g1_i2.p1 TRINITY_DN3107_c0_g1~~TRINITY_DN3107_c0_g1_i2.p1  ORF type:complete len:4037 (-),score=738.17 TRINITY_DN3107_c0_g1_i2:63-11216(-)
MPLDLKTPQARLEQMLEDAEARVAVSCEARAQSLSWLPCALRLVDDVLDVGGGSAPSPVSLPELTSEDPAYVLFTSGSTGTPKGVVLTHGNLLAYIGWHVPYYGLGHKDCVPHLAGLSFDASMAEIWPTLCVGACVLPAPDDDVRLLPEALCRWYAEAGATVTFLTTQLAEAVLSEPSYPSQLRLRILFTGGDKLHFGPPANAGFSLVNIYGPTECTVNVTMCLVPSDSRGPPPIGQPVAGSQLYVLDPQMRPQPIGIFGELFVGGPQVAAGYLKRPELTAEKFVSNPFAEAEAPASQAGPSRWPTGPCWQGRQGPAASAEQENGGLAARSLERAQAKHHSRLYRTGDLVRWTPDGTIDFLGRADCQVKLRGQRIELGEIEAKLLEHEAVRECVVVCRQLPNVNDKYLAGYWAPQAQAAATGASDDDPGLSDFLRAALPDYMVPKVFVRLPKLPVTANGKVDRRALPEPRLGDEEEDEKKPSGEQEQKELPASSAGDESTQALEGQIRATMAAVLGREQVPATSSFFALGGHSLSVGQLVNRLRRDLKLQDACLADVYASPNARALAARLHERHTSAVDAAAAQWQETLPDSKTYPASFQQAALHGMAQVGEEASAALNLAFCCHIWGPLDVPRLERALREVCLRHDALRSTFCCPAEKGDGQLSCEVREGDCLDFAQVENPADLSEWLLDQQYEVFDLSNGPLSRVRVLVESTQEEPASPATRARVRSHSDVDRGSWVLHWTLHHVSADLWSYNLLLKELGWAYDQLKSQEQVPWPAPAPQYRDYARGEAAWLASAQGQAAVNYWLEKLNPAPPRLELPGADRRPPAGRKTFKGSKVDFQLDREVLDKLLGIGRHCGVGSVHPVLLAAWMLLLFRHAQEEDVCVGVPMACRTTSESEAAVGYFVNPVCVRASVSGKFEELVRQVALDVQGALQHQRAPLALACERLGLEERALLQGMFVFQTCPDEIYDAKLPSFFMGHEGSELPLGEELTVESLGLGQRHAQFDLVLMMAKAPEGHLIGSFQYNSATYSRGAVLRLQAQFQRVLEAVAADPSQDVAEVQLFGSEDLRAIQQRASTPWPQEFPEESLPELFLAQAKSNPSAFAVVGPDGTCTFGEVVRCAELLAAALLGGWPSQATEVRRRSRAATTEADEAGVGSWQRERSSSDTSHNSPGLRAQPPPSWVLGEGLGSCILSEDAENPLVGLMVSPGKWIVAGPLGAWLAGRGYFPLDPGHPADRVLQMVQDACPTHIACERQHQSVANSSNWNCPLIVLEDLQARSRPRQSGQEPWPCVAPEGRGLLIFTSGSTGRPKGVLLSIQALLSHVLFSKNHFKFKPGQAVLQHTSWTFDAPICEMWPALLAGSTVVVSKREGSKDFTYLSTLLNEHRVSWALFVPSLLAEILEHQALPRSLRAMVVVGEACSLSLAGRILEAPLSLNNFYGPSEAGIGATIYEVDKIGSVPASVQTLPVGRPVSWRQVLLLDPQLRPAVGQAGQIAILGEGLAIGYLKLPEETKRRFVPTPQAVRAALPQCGPVMYLTGDVGRYCQDDLLEFVGRLDNQVKLRGQRVELGEVEQTLLSARAVTEAVAMVRGERLIAYFSTLQGVEEGEAVRQCMEKTRQRLPRYMWPELVHITEWPRGRTGKVDRKALRMPAICAQETVAPRNPLEEKLLALFCQALRRDKETVSVHSDFFALGGTSLRAAGLLSALRSSVPEASNLQFDELYGHPTVAGLAEVLSGSREAMTLGPAPVEGLMPASQGQEHMLVLAELQPNSAAYNSPLLLRLEGHVDRDALATAVERVVARHDVLRSNLLRDTFQDEPAVVQVTTPAAEFTFDMEYWPEADETQLRPKRLRLRWQMIGGRLQDRPASQVAVPAAGLDQPFAAASSPRIGRLGSLFSLASGPGRRTNSTSSPRHSTTALPHVRMLSGMSSTSVISPSRTPRGWRKWLPFPRRQRGRATPGSSTMQSPAMPRGGYQASPRGYMGYTSPPMASPELSRSRPLLQDAGGGTVHIVQEMSSGSSINLVGLDDDDNNSHGSSSVNLGFAGMAQWLVEEAKRPFDLRDEPLIRVVLAKESPNKHLLLINLHHSVTDGRSLAVLRQELTAAYRAQVLKQELQLPALSMQYADFAYWQRQWMAQGRLESQLAHWRRQLQGLQALQLPTDYVRPAVLKPDGAQVAFELPSGLANQLRSRAREKGCTLFTIMLGLFAAALGRHGGATDLAIASPVANRVGPEVEKLMGYFVNTVIFRAVMEPPCTFEELLVRLKEAALGAFRNSSAPYAVVLEAAQLEPGVVPAMFVLQDADDAWNLEGLRVERVAMPRTAALFDVTCELEEKADGKFEGLIVYNTNLWTAARAQRFTESFQALAIAAAEQPEAQLLSLPALSAADLNRVLEWGGHQQGKRTPALPLLKVFLTQLQKRSNEPAIITGDRTISYAEFGARVGALAKVLKQQLQGCENSKEEAVLGLLLGRSVEMAVGIWGCFGAGAAYVPIDPEYPADRIRHILESATPLMILCKEEHSGLVSGFKVLATSQWPGPAESLPSFEPPEPSRLAYVIYTSGSTGRPKGVAIEHRAAANMVREQIALMDIKSEDRVLQFFKPAFDGAVQEYLSTPCAGAALVLWDEDRGFGEAMSRHLVTVATLTPSALAVLEPSRLPRLRAVAVAAEACPPALISTWAFDGMRLVNAYGPSECTVVATSADLLNRSPSMLLEATAGQPSGSRNSDDSNHSQQHPQLQQQVPIGRPLRGVQCYVLEPTLGRALQPIGAPGELCLGGVQLARGYLGDATKTAEKFVANPLDRERMYKTGDLVMWLPSGELLYLGRNDEMVKVRGFRVELTEVEAALANVGAQAVAVGLNANKDGLWAWVTPQSLSASSLRAELLKTLPQYMVPQRIFPLDRLPLTPNGKIDKKRLLAETCTGEAMDTKDGKEDPLFVAPQTPLESRLCAAAAAALGLEKLGVTADLRTAGMSSLKAVLLSQKLRDMGLSMPLSALYELQTVRALAEHLSSEDQELQLDVQEEETDSRQCCCLAVCSGPRSLGRGCCRSLVFVLARLCAWTWISGVVIWPAVMPLSFASEVVLPKAGLVGALVWLVLGAYPLYLLGVALLVVLTKWVLIGRYRAGLIEIDSFAFLRWWAVDRLISYANDLCLAAFRGGPLYFGYLRALGLRASGYCRVDTRHISEFDLISLGRSCVVAEGAKLRPAAAEASVMHLRPMVFGDHCAVGENAVCTAGVAVGDNVTLQPLSLLWGRAGRTVPDGSVWKGAPLVQSRQQPIRLPTGRWGKDLVGDFFALLLALSVQLACALVAYCAFGALAQVQGFRRSSDPLDVWEWRSQAEGWLFAAAWLLFGPPVMASADVLLGIDLASYADQVAKAMGWSQWEMGLRIAGMIVISFAAHGWALTFISAVLCRNLRGSRRKNSRMFQVRRLLLRLTFPRYPAQLSGTWAMSLYLRVLGGSVSLGAAVALAEPPLEPRKMRVAKGALVLAAQALGECEVGPGSVIGADAVMLPHTEVEANAVVGAMSVAARPVRTGLQLVGNPGVITKRATLGKAPRGGWARRAVPRLVRLVYPVLAPMLLQFLLMVTLLPAMYFLTVVLNTLAGMETGWLGFAVLELWAISDELGHQAALTSACGSRTDEGTDADEEEAFEPSLLTGFACSSLGTAACCAASEGQSGQMVDLQDVLRERCCCGNDDTEPDWSPEQFELADIPQWEETGTCSSRVT